MTKDAGKEGAKASPETILTHSGRLPSDHKGYVNTPVFRGSTVLFDTLDALEDYDAPYRYGRNDNPTTRSVTDLITELEGAAGTVDAPSGLAAITTALLSVVEAGDEILVTDSAYEPTRNFCRDLLTRMGVTTHFYDPRIGPGIAALFTDKTKLVFLESPGSLTFEVQDLPAIAAAARARGIVVIVDNSWATPLFHRPLEHGADIVVHAGTKMFVGHSDAMYGTASANEALWPLLARGHRRLGMCASPDDSYLAARGLRTLGIRMKEFDTRSTAFARWLAEQPMVEKVYHPALPDHPDHALWKRDFTGSGSLFSMLLKKKPRAAVAAMVDGFDIFGMGYSWGGFESLCIPIHPERIRTAVKWEDQGCMFRVHIGLEDQGDLKADMAAALARFEAATP